MSAAIGPGSAVRCLVATANSRFGTGVYYVSQVIAEQQFCMACETRGCAGLLFYNGPKPNPDQYKGRGKAISWAGCQFAPYEGPELEALKRNAKEPTDA